MMWFGHPTGFGYGFGMMGGFGWIAMLMLVIVVAIVAMGLLKNLFAEHGERARTRQGLRDIVDQRYARGEIDSEEYARKRAQLEL